MRKLSTSGIPWLAVACQLLYAAALLIIGGTFVRADQVEMRNGDRYIGNIISLNSDSLLMRNDVLGSVRVPRNKVATISFDPVAETHSLAASPTNALGSPLTATTNANTDLAVTLRQLGGQTNLIQQIQGQFLSGAGPEANNKFNELLNGLVTGKLTLGDLRNEAKSAADQLRALKKDVGDDSGFAVDGYLSILDGFLAETTTYDNSGTTTNQVKAVLSPPAR